MQSFQPISTAPTNPFIQIALTAAQRNFPNKVKLAIINGATDASVFTLHRPDLPVVVLGCDAWNQAHQNDEYTSLASYFATIKTYQQTIKDFFA